MLGEVSALGKLATFVEDEPASISGSLTKIASNPVYWDVLLPEHSEIELPIPDGHTALAYVFEGEGIFGWDEFRQGEIVKTSRLIRFDPGGLLNMKTGFGVAVRFILIGRKPISEPIVRYGPFVMNTEEEIRLNVHEMRNGMCVKN